MDSQSHGTNKKTIIQSKNDIWHWIRNRWIDWYWIVTLCNDTYGDKSHCHVYMFTWTVAFWWRETVLNGIRSHFVAVIIFASNQTINQREFLQRTTIYWSFGGHEYNEIRHLFKWNSARSGSFIGWLQIILNVTEPPHRSPHQKRVSISQFYFFWSQQRSICSLVQRDIVS